MVAKMMHNTHTNNSWYTLCFIIITFLNRMYQHYIKKNMIIVMYGLMGNHQSVCVRLLAV